VRCQAKENNFSKPSVITKGADYDKRKVTLSDAARRRNKAVNTGCLLVLLMPVKSNGSRRLVGSVPTIRCATRYGQIR
jgi:hypothetical protein